MLHRSNRRSSLLARPRRRRRRRRPSGNNAAELRGRVESAMIKYDKLRRVVIGAPLDPLEPDDAPAHRAGGVHRLGRARAPTGCRRRPTGPRKRSRRWARIRTWACSWRWPPRRRCSSSRSRYNQVIELFPTGGGGYRVATSLIGPRAGLVSGAALIVDYVLTIAISVASGVDALFSLLPAAVGQLQARHRAAAGRGAAGAQPARDEGVDSRAAADLRRLLHHPPAADRLRRARALARADAGRAGRAGRIAKSSCTTSAGSPRCRCSCAPTRSGAAPTPASRRSRTTSRRCASRWCAPAS